MSPFLMKIIYQPFDTRGKRAETWVGYGRSLNVYVGTGSMGNWLENLLKYSALLVPVAFTQTERQPMTLVCPKWTLSADQIIDGLFVLLQASGAVV